MADLLFALWSWSTGADLVLTKPALESDRLVLLLRRLDMPYLQKREKQTLIKTTHKHSSNSESFETLVHLVICGLYLVVLSPYMFSLQYN